MVMAGSDIIKNDGMYAAYVLASDLMGNGRYNIKIKAGSVENVTPGRVRERAVQRRPGPNVLRFVSVQFPSCAL